MNRAHGLRNRQSALDEPPMYPHPACRAVQVSTAPLTRISAYCVGRVLGGDSLPIEQKSAALGALALSVAEGVHQLAELGGTLDLEEDLVVVVGDFDVEVVRVSLLLLWSVLLRHLGPTDEDCCSGRSKSSLEWSKCLVTGSGKAETLVVGCGRGGEDQAYR